MDRKSLIYCLAVLSAMIFVIVAGTAYLYRKDVTVQKTIEEKYYLAGAVPANAVAVVFLSQASNLDSPVFSSFEFPQKLSEYFQQGFAKSIAQNRMAISLQYAGSLTPLIIFDAGPSGQVPSEDAEGLMQFIRDNGIFAEYVDCSELSSDNPLSSRSIVLAAKTEALIRSTRIQMKGDASLLRESDGFRNAALNSSEDALFVSYNQARTLFQASVSRSFFRKRYPAQSADAEYSSMAGFFSTIADWGVVDLSDERKLDFIQYISEPSDFMCVMDHSSPSVSRVSEILPYSTRFVLTLPMDNSSSYISSYEDYLESVQKMGKVAELRKALLARKGVKPEDFVRKLGVEEVATASIPTSEGFGQVNLVKIRHADELLSRGTDVMQYEFPEFIASVFGPFFSLADESCFTLCGQWLVTGSKAAVSEFASGNAMKYSLKTYMADAGQDDLLTSRVASCVIYVDIPKGDKSFADVLKEDVHKLHDEIKGDAEYAPIIMTVYKKDGQLHTDIQAHQFKMQRLRPEKFERDMTVDVPEGPYEITNQATGKTYLFYQKNNAIGLKTEDGRGLWSIHFDKAVCGRVHGADYYRNGNFQILFGAGSDIYLMKPSGAYVPGYPKNIGKEILLGPDVYETGRDDEYRLMVLHKDNTVEMYDLGGRKPDGWKGIDPGSPIRDLPERLVVGNKDYWVVRTSVQVLIYPFNGGQPLNSFSGDEMFIPFAEVVVKNSNTVEAECYDGRMRTVTLN